METLIDIERPKAYASDLVSTTRKDCGPVLDRIRNYVAHASPQVSILAGWLTYPIPTNLKYGDAFRTTRANLERARQDPSWAKERQQELLSEILNSVLTSRYYQGYFSTTPLEIAPSNASAMLSEFPVIDRGTVAESATSLIADPNIPTDKVSTSGSSGEPLSFLLDKNRAASEWAYVCDAWSSSGFQPRMWRAHFRGAPLGKRGQRQHLTIPSSREIKFSSLKITQSDISAYWAMISRRNILFLHAYPSVLERLANYAITNNCPHAKNVEGLFPVSEPILAHQYSLFSEAFPNAAILPFYGLSERSAMAYSSPGEATYSTYPHYGIVEILDAQGSPVSVGEEGRVVTTGLRMKSMPLVRYDTGDIATYGGQGQDGSVILSGIKGRRLQESLYDSSMSAIPITGLTLHGRAFEGIRAYRLVQRNPGEVEVLIELGELASEATASNLCRAFSRRTGGRLHFSYKIVNIIPPSPNGKLQLVQQYLGADN